MPAEIAQVGMRRMERKMHNCFTASLIESFDIYYDEVLIT